jgi:hypothetical protein
MGRFDTSSTLSPIEEITSSPIEPRAPAGPAATRPEGSSGYAVPASGRRTRRRRQDLDRSAVFHAVGGVPFAQETLAHVLVARQIRVKHFDGGARAVPVARRVHRSHASDAEKRLKRPLVVEHASYPRSRSTVEVLNQTG